MQTFLVFIIFLVIVAGLVLFTSILFYHIGRYSYIGDWSKRSFIFYVGFSTFFVVIAFLCLLINHLVSY